MWLCSQVQWAHGIMLVCQLFYSGWHLVGSIALKKGADPFVFVLYRELFASVVMLALLRYQRIPIVVDRRDYGRFFVLGLCSFFNVVGAMLALKYISASRFAIFQPSIPCIATVISICLGLERLTLLKTLGIALAVGGAVLAEAWQSDGSSSNDDHNGGSDLVIGTGIVCAQVAGMACLVVFSKPILTRYTPALVTFVYYAIGTGLTMVLFAAYAFQFSGRDLIFDAQPLPWLALAYAVAFPTVFNYNALSWCGKLLAPSTTTVYSTFQPISTIVLSFLVLGQLISLAEGVGAALVVLGLLVNVSAQHHDAASRKKDSLSSSLSSSSSFSSATSAPPPPPVASVEPSAPPLPSHEDEEAMLLHVTAVDDDASRVSRVSSGDAATWTLRKPLLSVVSNSMHAAYRPVGDDDAGRDAARDATGRARVFSGDTASSGGLSSISSGRRSLPAGSHFG